MPKAKLFELVNLYKTLPSLPDVFQSLMVADADRRKHSD